MRAAQKGTHKRILETGFADLDHVLSISCDGDLSILAGRPAMGKTALALNLARTIAQSREVMVFSLEMGSEQLWARLVAEDTGVSVGRQLRGEVNDGEWDGVYGSLGALGRLKLTIDERPSLSVGQLLAAAKRQEARGQRPSAIFVDYLQLMTPDDARGTNRAAAIGQISRGLKQAAREIGCAVIALSQLSRQVESRDDKRPILSDLKESGDIEANADSVLFIYRDDYYAEQESRESKAPGQAEVNVAKQRAGSTGRVFLAFDKARTRFSDYHGQWAGEIL